MSRVRKVVVVRVVVDIVLVERNVDAVLLRLVDHRLHRDIASKLWSSPERAPVMALSLPAALPVVYQRRRRTDASLRKRVQLNANIREAAAPDVEDHSSGQASVDTDSADLGMLGSTSSRVHAAV